MKRTSVALIAACLLSVFASTSFGQATGLTASIVGSVSGIDGTDGSDYSVTSPSMTDIDFSFANVGNYAITGGDAVNRGGLSASAFAKHPPTVGEPGILGMDLQGSLTAARQTTGGVNSNGIPSYFSAGSMSVGVKATAEYDDEVTLEFDGPPGDLLTMEGIVYLEGFAALTAVATGGIDPNNVSAHLSGTLVGANTIPVVFGARKKATGETTKYPNPSDPFNLDLLAMNPAIAFIHDFHSGIPSALSLKLEMTGIAEFGDGSSVTLSPGFAFASFEAHYSNTLKWGGITRVVNRRTGEVVTDYRITSAAGFDYTQDFPVPEPGSLVALLIGIGCFVCRKRPTRYTRPASQSAATKVVANSH